MDHIKVKTAPAPKEGTNEEQSIWRTVYDPDTILQAVEENTYYELYAPEDYTSLGFSPYGEEVLNGVIDGMFRFAEGLRELKKTLGDSHELNRLARSALNICGYIARLALGVEPVGYIVTPLVSELKTAASRAKNVIDYLENEHIDQPNVDRSLDRIAVGLASMHDGLSIIEQAVDDGR